MTTHRARLSRWLALIMLALGAAVLAVGAAETPNAPNGMLAEDAESTQVSRILAGSDAGQDGSAAIVVFTSADGTPLDAEELAALGEKAEHLGGPLVPAEDHSAAIVPVTVESTGLTDNVAAVDRLRAEAAADLPAGVTSAATGSAAVDADLSGVFEGANVLLLAVTGGIVAVLLIVTYRSPVLWLLPLAVIGLADRVAAAVFTWVLSAAGTVWNESTAGIVSVLVFGAGTNYALLLISRYRDELTGTDDRFTAMARAWGPTVRTVAASALTVVVGMACLLASVVPATRGLGLAAAVGVTVAFCFATLCLPGVLVAFGRWVFWPRVPAVGEPARHGVWRRVGRLVAARPRTVVAAALLALAGACLGAGQITTGLGQSDQFIDTPESITAAAELERAFPEQDATPLKVATRIDDAAREALEAAGGTVSDQGTAGSGAGEQWRIFSVSGLETHAARAALAGTDSLVGGQEAQLVDTEAAAARDRAVVFPLILGLIFIALAALLRSLVAPLLMTATVLLTNIAALGLGWWVSTGLFGFERFDSSTPLYAFVFLVALGIDYSIFLLTRTREEAAGAGTGEEAAGAGTRDGVLSALSATGGVITSAGILLAAVFAALGVLPLVALAQVGVVIFIGVLLDTLVVRTLLIPALVRLIGERLWWPSKIRQESTGKPVATPV